MAPRFGTTLVSVAVVVGLAGCHKHAPPVTQPTAVLPPSSVPVPGARPAAPAPSAPMGPDSRSIDAARETLAETIGDVIHFDYNEAVLRPQDKVILDNKAAVLRANPAVRIRITGNCDERGSDQYNIALGMRRATAAKDYLTVEGVSSGRIDVASLGRENPLDRSSSEEAWAKNRRDEFVTTIAAQR
jgi:peptidoglycan-associated lipoprotein